MPSKVQREVSREYQKKGLSKKAADKIGYATENKIKQEQKRKKNHLRKKK